MEYLGTVDNVHAIYPDSLDMGSLMRILYNLDVYHGYAVHSTAAFTSDGLYWAVSWYWQEPADVGCDAYYYWILSDVSDPNFWYRAVDVSVRGIRLGPFMGVDHRSARFLSWMRLSTV